MECLIDDADLHAMILRHGGNNAIQSIAHSLADGVEFPRGEGPVPHTVRFIDPRDVEAHFAALGIKPTSPEERWARKANATPFPGV